MDLFYLFCSIQIRNLQNNKCLDTMMKDSGQKVGLFGCHGQGGNQVRLKMIPCQKREKVSAFGFCFSLRGPYSNLGPGCDPGLGSVSCVCSGNAASMTPAFRPIHFWSCVYFARGGVGFEKSAGACTQAEVYKKYSMFYVA